MEEKDIKNKSVVLVNKEIKKVINYLFKPLSNDLNLNNVDAALMLGIVFRLKISDVKMDKKEKDKITNLTALYLHEISINGGDKFIENIKKFIIKKENK